MRPPFRTRFSVTGRDAIPLVAGSVALSTCVIPAMSANGAEIGGGRGSVMILTSPAFTNGQPLAIRYTGDGVDISPPLSWTNAPEGTHTFALICDDPDAPVGTWVHWVLYDIPASQRCLPENMAKTETVLGSAKQGLNDFGRIGYNGPAPPRGKPHRYFFTLYAVAKPVGLKPGATKAQVLAAIKGNILSEAQLMGIYQRK